MPLTWPLVIFSALHNNVSRVHPSHRPTRAYHYQFPLCKDSSLACVLITGSSIFCPKVGIPSFLDQLLKAITRSHARWIFYVCELTGSVQKCWSPKVMMMIYRMFFFPVLIVHCIQVGCLLLSRPSCLLRSHSAVLLSYCPFWEQ